MTSLVAPIKFNDQITVRSSHHILNNNNTCPRHVLKTKNFKHKCDKAFKKKLRKYKLRKNGEEDQDVIDVSHILLSTLKIKSPNKFLRSPNKSDSEEKQPKNYLFKMARRKQKIKPEGSEEVVKSSKDTGGGTPLVESQEKKQTDAFKLMMNSRNKSIGSNSPGKEKNADPNDNEEKEEKKNVKAKRNLALQKMAEAKGSLKKQEIEEYQELNIKNKMEKRKERLKSMIVDNKKSKYDTEITSKSPESTIIDVVQIDVDSTSTNKIKSNKLQMVDIFKDIIKPNNISPDKKKILKEDEEFLKKLSPSIRKKENMLSYFKKIEKNADHPIDVDIDVDGSSPVLKVKVSHKIKKKIKKRKLSLNKDTVEPIDVLKNHNENNAHINNVEKLGSNSTNSVINNSGRKSKKRKRKENPAEPELSSCETINGIRVMVEAVRPKRNIKKPVKYVDDVLLSSSDDDLPIFTSKKRKHSEQKIKCISKESLDDVIISDSEKTQKKSSKTEKEDKMQRKSTKLAPIFAPKPQLSAEQMEAKQRFLYSGVPDQIKKFIAQQKSFDMEISNCFPVVVHVQQNEVNASDSNIPSFIVKPECDSKEDLVEKDVMPDRYKSMINITEADSSHVLLPPKNNATTVLQNIKELYPKFPVYRTFRSLKSISKAEIKESSAHDLENSIELINNITDELIDNPNYLNWTEKYKPSSNKHVIGNFASINELKKWLLSWTENKARLKKKKSNESGSSDFYDSDSNSKDNIKTANNLLILTGPVGCGKTSGVYAVAAELAIKVIEVNASSKRTGKVMLQDLQEATQSHKVNRGGLENSQKSLEVKDTVKSNKKRGRPSKKILNENLKKANSKEEILSQTSVNQESSRTGMSLILVDDADIVFDQDDGFASAISQLAQCSKRPVILVTGSLTCPHLQKFLLYGKIIKMNPLPPQILGTWLDIMCLVDNGSCWPGLGAKFLNYFKGDMRKSINSLQFYMTADSQVPFQGGEVTSHNSDHQQSSDDEKSNMSWADTENIDENNAQKFDGINKIWKCIMKKEVDLSHLRYPKDLLNVWWSVPTLLSQTSNDGVRLQSAKIINLETVSSKQIKELDAIANVMDNISLSDYYSKEQPDTSCKITSQPWYMSELDSVSEQENLDYYERNHEVTSAIIQELVTCSITEAQRHLQCDRSTAVQFPSMAVQRIKDRTISRHDNITRVLNPSAVLDRRALALDYWSSCRTICRVEKNRTDTGLKRNNRFCHYLKSLNADGSNDSFHKLADSLC